MISIVTLEIFLDTSTSQLQHQLSIDKVKSFMQYTQNPRCNERSSELLFSVFDLYFPPFLPHCKTNNQITVSFSK